jgi:hypothetical protein
MLLQGKEVLLGIKDPKVCCCCCCYRRRRCSLVLRTQRFVVVVVTGEGGAPWYWEPKGLLLLLSQGKEIEDPKVCCCCCYRGRRCSLVLRTRLQTLHNGSIRTLCLPSETMIYLWLHSLNNRVAFAEMYDLSNRQGLTVGLRWQQFRSMCDE